MIATACDNLSPDSRARVTAQCDFCTSENCCLEETVEYRDVVTDPRYKCTECRQHEEGGNDFFDRGFMAQVDTEEKAYFLGWIAAMEREKEERENGTVAIKITKRKLDSIESLHLCSWWFEITLRSNSIYFIIHSSQVWKDICRYLECGCISLLDTDDLRWHFIRGYFECSGFIQLSPPVCNMPFYESIQEFVAIPSRKWNNDLEFRDTNAIDFLGKIYEQAGTCRVEREYKLYTSLLQPKPPICILPHCQVYKTSPDAILPSKNKTSDVGYDLSIIRKEKELLNNVVLYDTGIKIRVKNGIYAEVVPRSSLSKSGYMLANSIGIIDPSYNGRILVALVKIDPTAPDLQLPFRCCQLIFRNQVHCEMIEVAEDFEQTARGEGGFGSTG